MRYISIMLTLVLLLGGCAYQDATLPNDTPAPSANIVIKDYQFYPQTLTVNVNDTVTWKNLDRDRHSLQYKNIESKLLSKGELFSIVAAEPGTYEYSSANHPFIQGKLIVTDTEPESSQ